MMNIVSRDIIYNENSKIEEISYCEIYYKKNEEINEEDINLLEGAVKIFFCDDFNESIDNLPDNIKYINLGENFQRDINKLPKEIKLLELKNSWTGKLNCECNKLKLNFAEYWLDNNLLEKINFKNIEELDIVSQDDRYRQGNKNIIEYFKKNRTFRNKLKEMKKIKSLSLDFSKIECLKYKFNILILKDIINLNNILSKLKLTNLNIFSYSKSWNCYLQTSLKVVEIAFERKDENNLSSKKIKNLPCRIEELNFFYFYNFSKNIIFNLKKIPYKIKKLKMSSSYIMKKTSQKVSRINFSKLKKLEELYYRPFCINEEIVLNKNIKKLKIFDSNYPPSAFHICKPGIRNNVTLLNDEKKEVMIEEGEIYCNSLEHDNFNFNKILCNMKNYKNTGKNKLTLINEATMFNFHNFVDSDRLCW